MDHRVLVTDRCVANGQRQKTLALSRSRSPARRSSGDLDRQRVVKQIASLRGYISAHDGSAARMVVLSPLATAGALCPVASANHAACAI